MGIRAIPDLSSLDISVQHQQISQSNFNHPRIKKTMATAADSSSQMDAPAPVAAPAPSKTKKTSAKKTQKPAPEHPPFNEMVMAAVIDGHPLKGVSLHAIKKYVIALYQLPTTTMTNTNIKLAVKRNLAAGRLILNQWKQGGHFKLPKYAKYVKPNKLKTPVKKSAKSSRTADKKSNTPVKKSVKKPVKKSVKTPVKKSANTADKKPKKGVQNAAKKTAVKK